MNKVGRFLKKTGKIILWILLGLVVLIGSFVIWLRVEREEVTSCETGFRLMAHYVGGVCVPEDTQRVIAVSSAANQFFIAIEHPMGMMAEGIDLAFAADIPGLYARLRQINEAAGVTDLGRFGGSAAQSLELLLEIDPDVILSEAHPGDLEKPASLIAPRVIVSHLESWKELTLYTGELIGEEAVAKDMLQGYEERVQILRDQFDNPAEITISTASLLQNRTALQLPTSFWGQIAADVGFSFPDEQLDLVGSTAISHEYEISNERLDLIEADYLFVYVGQADQVLVNQEMSSETIAEAFQNDPLYQLLNVVESGNVYEVDLYWGMPGIYSAHYVLDDLFRHVAGVDPEEIAPNPLLLE